MALLFAAHSVTAPFWVLCHATGPDAHDRLELVFSGCCSCCEGRASHPAISGRMLSCALDSNDCDACHDERLDQPSVVRPVQDAGPTLLCAALPVTPLLLVVPRVVPQELAFLPDHSGDPPLFLTCGNFRI